MKDSAEQLKKFTNLAMVMVEALFKINRNPVALLKVLPLLSLGIIKAALLHDLDKKDVPKIMKDVACFVDLALNPEEDLRDDYK